MTIFRLAGLRHGVLANRDGLAATEFALFLPVMLLLFFGMLEGADLLTVDRRLAHAGNTAADLAARERTMTYAELNDMLVGARRLLEPTDTSTLNIKVISVISAGTPAQPTVHWSRDLNGATPYVAGAAYTGIETLTTLNAASSLIIVEIDYTYESGLTSRVFNQPYVFGSTAKRLPRKSTRVQLCSNATPAVCTS